MIKIVPAVLPKSFAELEQGLVKLRGVATEVQVDLVGTNVLAGRTMPHWEDFEFEADIMLANPKAELDAVLALGPSRIVVHDSREVLGALQSMRDGNYPIALGVAVLPASSPEVLDEYAGLYDFIQVMGIAEVGAQGRPFDPRAVDLVARLRALHPVVSTQVDGGVNRDTAKALADAGADRLVVGSAILGAKDASAAYKELYTLVNGTGAGS